MQRRAEPSRPSLGLHPQARFDRPAAVYDFTGRRLRLPTPNEALTAPEEPSPMMEAIRRYLDSLP
ncbi:MAG: hypothetical protein SFW67_05095 [Myxococcaceae bacterium]|nr:hypothetical protein [Myxococcaceae bacterium]